MRQEILRPYRLRNTITPWERVAIVRNAARQSSMNLIEYLFKDFCEMHGDRLFGDDSALVGGIAIFHGVPVTVISQERGHTPRQRHKRNYGMLHPEGYRKAMRLASQAERFHRPVICIVDTPGAYPGIGAEERGQAEAIAQSLLLFSSVRTPVLSVVLGQGGSGGALALSTADRILMFENATFSVISPEGFASICWKDPNRANEAAAVMKMTAQELQEMGVVDEIIPETEKGLQNNPGYSFSILEKRLSLHMKELMEQPLDELVLQRRNKLRRGFEY